MAVQMPDEFDRRTMPWMTIGFDWEGIAAAGGAFLAALLLGWIWPPLFWIGFAATVLALAAGRWSRRSPPDIAEGIVAPCDGVVVSIERVEPPPGLRLVSESVIRLRIASSPAVTNKLYVPISGGVEASSTVQGETNVPLAFQPDDEGLSRAFITLESAGEQAGLVVATGGFGPRIELDVEAGDVVRLGRVMGTRRLGGWCDLYLPSHVTPLVWPGQTLVGGETVIGRMVVDANDDADVTDGAFSSSGLRAAAGNPVSATASAAGHSAAEAAASSDAPRPEEDLIDEYPEPDEVDAPDDPAAVFARLREAARRHGEGD